MRQEFVVCLVGFLVGKFGLPDMEKISGINSLDGKCRVCRVFIGEESAGEFGVDDSAGFRPLEQRLRRPQPIHILGLE